MCSEQIDNNLSFLSVQDQQLFEKLYPFIWFQGEPLVLIYDVTEEVYVEQGVTLSVLRQLEKNGLIIVEPSGFVKRKFGQHTRLFCGGKLTKIGFSEPMDNQLDLGHVLLTELGKRIAGTCNIPRNQACYEYVINRWFQQGLILSSIQLNFKPAN